MDTEDGNEESAGTDEVLWRKIMDETEDLESLKRGWDLFPDRKFGTLIKALKLRGLTPATMMSLPFIDVKAIVQQNGGDVTLSALMFERLNELSMKEEKTPAPSAKKTKLSVEELDRSVLSRLQLVRKWDSHRVMESIIEFETFVEKESLQHCEVFQLLKHYVSGYHFTILSKNSEVLIGKTWEESRKAIVTLLDPKTNEEHEEDLQKLRPMEDETMEDFDNRFNKHISFLNIDKERTKQIFLKALPEIYYKEVVRKCWDVDRKTMILFETVDDIQAYLHTLYRDPATKCYITGKPRFTKQKEGSQNKKKCWLCGSLEHLRNGCPKKQIESANGKLKRPEKQRQTTNAKNKRTVFVHPRTSNIRKVTTNETQGEDAVNLQVEQDPFNDGKHAILDKGTPPAEIGLTINDVHFVGILDTGADHCYIPKRCLERLDPSSFTFSTQRVSVTLTEDKMRERAVVLLSIMCLEKRGKHPFGVLETDSSSILLGRDFIGKWDIEIPLLAKAEVDKLLSQYQIADLEEVMEAEKLKESNGIEYHMDHAKLIQDIEAEIALNLETENKHSTIGEIPIVFENKESARRGSWQQQHRMPETTQSKYELQVKEWLEKRIIEEQEDLRQPELDKNGNKIGRFNTRTFTVFSGKMRFVNDFVHINNLIMSDTNEVPSIDDAFLEIAKGQPIIYSKLDLRSAYLQVPLRSSDRYITAFTCGRKRYRFITAH